MSWAAARGIDHHRGEPAQQLLDGGGDAARVVDEPLPLLGVGGEVLDHAVEGGRHRVEPAEQEQVADAEQLGLVERAAVDGGVDDLGQQACRRARARRSAIALAEVVGDGVGGLLADARGALVVAGRDVGPDRVVPPLEEHREVLVGQAHQRQEDARRQRRGELLVEVARPALGEARRCSSPTRSRTSGASFSISRGTNCGLRMRR